MILRLGILFCTLLIAVQVNSAEYRCKVYCNNGSTYVTVKGDSAREAASRVDGNGHQVCKADGKGEASKKTMNEAQCSRK